MITNASFLSLSSYVNITLLCLDIVRVPGKITADFLTLPQLQLMMATEDLFEIGKYIDSTFKQKFFTTEGDTEALGS